MYEASKIPEDSGAIHLYGATKTLELHGASYLADVNFSNTRRFASVPFSKWIESRLCQHELVSYAYVNHNRNIRSHQRVRITG